jgi:hypothetical protein
LLTAVATARTEFPKTWLRTFPCWRRTWASSAVVVDLPELPVTAMTFAVLFLRMAAAARFSRLSRRSRLKGRVPVRSLPSFANSANIRMKCSLDNTGMEGRACFGGFVTSPHKTA